MQAPGSIGCVCRPKPGEKSTIRVNRWLAVAVETAMKGLHLNMAAVQMTFLITILHDFGHTFGLYVRGGAVSPLVLSIARREDIVTERGPDGVALKNEDGSPKQGKIGEAGYLVEQRLLGKTYKLQVLSQRLSDNHWLSIRGVQVQDTNKASCAISHSIAEQWMQDFAASRLTELSLGNAQPLDLEQDLIRLKLVNALETHSPPVSPPNSERGTRQLLATDMTGRTSIVTVDWEGQDSA